MATLFTIGYEGAALDDFLVTLKRAGVSCIVDIRELPMSRRKGFSKKALAEALSSESIDYIHLKSLGDPKAGREAARMGDYERFRSIFLKHLATDAAQFQLREAGEIASKYSACLLCYEREPEHCHRSLVASNLSCLFGVSVRHLGVVVGLASKFTAGAELKTCREIELI